jgi:hypothetical protein
MNDAMTATDLQGQEGKEAHDFVEMGTASEETKGDPWGATYDGIPGTLRF